MNKNVNLGLAIEQRINELGITKSEFGRRIGIPNQNVNRLLSKSSIDSDKLVEICKALDFDFFKLFSSPVEESKSSMLNIEKIKSVMGLKNISVTKLASKVAMTRGEIEAILDGCDLTLSSIERIAKVLDINPVELINGASTAEATPINDASLRDELIELRAENKLLREIQGLPARKMANVG